MSNQIFQSLVKSKIDNLKSAYETSKDIFWDKEKKQLIHPGEYGEFREKAVSELLNFFIPQNLKISEGFIISSDGGVSTQCDIIIYDPNSCPKIADSAHQKFFPIECVVAIGEIKSEIKTKSDLTKILTKLAEIKKLKELVPEATPYRSYKDEPFIPLHKPFDQIYSFVLSKSLPKSLESDSFINLDIEQRHMHNILVGIDSGHHCYTYGKMTNYYYPETSGEQHEQVWRTLKEKELPTNFGIFLTSLFYHCQIATLLELDIVRYCTNEFTNEP
ncbi:hypothetical protein CXF72_04275 [Psychromonas sp. MB-3u-54]|uniref:DUF6602 domain-containing protein n=1 Tax=Psychromonas sp. MB-3u-54 TaxID=2058319 RepID=UPI000C34D5DF|nr:DUF6602 domain-containing protein [Psychromonas sp. MB-3u-54]PKH03797.1 hypothetical protein CXF72_04275 [Psychromonas sp. MB-3u-54]